MAAEWPAGIYFPMVSEPLGPGRPVSGERHAVAREQVREGVAGEEGVFALAQSR